MTSPVDWSVNVVAVLTATLAAAVNWAVGGLASTMWSWPLAVALPAPLEAVTDQARSLAAVGVNDIGPAPVRLSLPIIHSIVVGLPVVAALNVSCWPTAPVSVPLSISPPMSTFTVGVVSAAWIVSAWVAVAQFVGSAVTQTFIETV